MALELATEGTRPCLTDKEMQVFELIARGLPAKSIARMLGNEKSTIDSITKTIRRKYAEAGRRIVGRVDFAKKFHEDGYEIADA